MLSVLSTLSGTIAIKHYFSIASGKEKKGEDIWIMCFSPVDGSGGFFCKALESRTVSVLYSVYMPVTYLRMISSLMPVVITFCILDHNSRVFSFLDLPCFELYVHETIFSRLLNVACLLWYVSESKCPLDLSTFQRPDGGEF